MDEDAEHAAPDQAAHESDAVAAGDPEATIGAKEPLRGEEHPPAAAQRRGRGSSAAMYLVPGTDDATATARGTVADGDPVGETAAPDTQPRVTRDSPGDHEWPWVAEWRAGGEPTPWAMGLVLAAFSALVVAVAVWVLCAGLADRPIVAVLVNLVVAAGLAPAMWLSRSLPVLRWIAAGALAGILCGWAAALLMLPSPG